jgi:hypothetical protein
VKTGVLALDDAEAWRRVVERQPLADVFHLPEYHRAAVVNGEGTAYAYVAEDGDDVLLHPFLHRPIEGGGTDIETVYGYSGPVATTEDPVFLERAWRDFDDWCATAGVVAEFVRFNPLSANERTMGTRYDVRFARDSVVVDLAGTEAELWERYPPRQRNMVRRALAEQLTVEELSGGDGLQAFVSLYSETMARVGAGPRYAFSCDYFVALHDGLESGVRILAAKRGEDIAAAALFLLYGDRMHYHLAGNAIDQRRGGAGNLLLHEAICWGATHGYRRLHLGGGLGSRPDDPLLRFKRGISALTVPAHVGGRVHDPEAYEELCAAWMREHGVTERPPFFLLWRASV